MNKKLKFNDNENGTNGRNRMLRGVYHLKIKQESKCVFLLGLPKKKKFKDKNRVKLFINI